MLYILSVLIGVVLLTLLFYIAKMTKPTGKYLEDEETHIGTRLQIIGLYLSCLVPIVNIILPVVLLLCGILLLLSGEYVFRNKKYNRFSGFIKWLNEEV